MSLSGVPETQNPQPTTRTRRSSSWVELFAIPITLSVMEAQPLALTLILVTQIFVGSNTSTLGIGGIALLELGLMWWAMAVAYLTQRNVITKNSTNTLLIAAWIVALVVVIGPRFVQGQNIVQALILLILITWLWRRGIAYAQRELEYSSVALPFKIGLGIVLGALFIVTILPGLTSLRTALPTALPIFFLSGLIAISLARLGTLRAARARADEAHTDPTRSWLLALTIFGTALIILVIIIESIFSFSTLEAVVTALNPIWNAIGTVVYWLLYGLVFLLTPVYYFFLFLVGHRERFPPVTPPGSKLANHPINPSSATTGIVAQAIAIGRWVLLALILLAVLIIMIKTMQRLLRQHDDGGVEEIRERLDARSLLAERWRAWRNRRWRAVIAGPTLEALDPLSARARYRELLQETALTSEILARKPSETPNEYQHRLLRNIQQRQADAGATSAEVGPASEAILNTLTAAYADERYGGKPTNEGQRRRLQDWLPSLLARMSGKTKS